MRPKYLRATTMWTKSFGVRLHFHTASPIFDSNTEKTLRSATWVTILQHIRRPPVGPVRQPMRERLPRVLPPESRYGSSPNHPLWNMLHGVQLLKLCLTRTHLARIRPGRRVPSPGCVALAQSPRGSAVFSRQMNFFQETWDGASPAMTFIRPGRKGLRRLWAVENHQHTA
jgi:hypothetical protein